MKESGAISRRAESSWLGLSMSYSTHNQLSTARCVCCRLAVMSLRRLQRNLLTPTVHYRLSA